MGNDHFQVSVTASPSGNPRQGVISRHHECRTHKDAVDFLEILVDQVQTAVEAVGGRVVRINHPTRDESIPVEGA